MSGVVAKGEAVKVVGFNNPVLKKFSILEREGKKPVYFVEFVNAENFETTGEMIFLKRDMTQQQAMEYSKLELKPVSVELSVSPYNGRSSVACVDIKPV